MIDSRETFGGRIARAGSRPVRIFRLIALVLAAFVVVVYVGTWAKMGAAIFNRQL